MATPDQIELPLARTLGTGILSIILVLAIAAACIAPFDHHFFLDWIGTAFMAATPVQIVLGLLWHNNKPDSVARLAQPLKGLALTGITILIALLVMGLVMVTVGKGHGPTPMVAHYFIMSIVVTMWMIPIWQCWPASLMSKNPVAIGIFSLVLAYVFAYVLWLIFFDYSMLGEIGHPHYHEDLDPKGLFDMWTAVIFFTTTAGLIVVHFLFDLWPIEKLSMGRPQPVRGLIATAYLLALAWGMMALFIDVLGMPPVEYMVRVPVCMIFGTFLVNNMMQFSLFKHRDQPVRGLLLTACAVVVAMVMYELYRWASGLHAGQALGVGPQGGFAQEIWIASAMLGVTFPVVFVVTGFFGFWPIQRSETMPKDTQS